MIAKSTHRDLTRLLQYKGDLRASLESFLEKHAPRRRKPSLRKAEKEEKKLGKKGARADVRAACVARCNQQCEACGQPSMYIGPLEMDHFYGRAFSESVETCWMLGPECHRQKTENDPTREFWDAKFAIHCKLYGYPFRPRLTKQLTGSSK